MPLDAAASRLAPASTARDTSCAAMRSLWLPVGLPLSHFSQTCATPCACASDGSSRQGVRSSPSVIGARTGSGIGCVSAGSYSHASEAG
ncbi:hypothetical protein A8B95_13510 [Bordetella pertussis]|nr:hypothetical protein A8B95_13510 [Bordetella pertussis]CFU13247.1 Uncharacterised protein [Bordetella pertussis]